MCALCDVCCASCAVGSHGRCHALCVSCAVNYMRCVRLKDRYDLQMCVCYEVPFRKITGVKEPFLYTRRLTSGITRSGYQSDLSGVFNTL
ncbi:hypothetical protein L914_14164 [Phytophthora nicotianae]|uniref:Uncharacterized protein n=1 Tax=Phytophthora nicotianae TaxID=4792 RepID=W2MW42_PHYNI|nr:hypothetical protein L914_14164 [Phytophthora nicotianae]